MDLPEDFRGLIACWPSQRTFGRDIAGEGQKGHIFHRRNRVPPKLHHVIVALAPDHGLQGVTLEYLARLHLAGRKQGR